MLATLARKTVDRFGAYLVATPITTIIFGYYGTFLPFGAIAVLGFGAVGVAWSLLIGYVAQKLMDRAPRASTRLANAPVFLCIVGTGLLIGGGFMYTSMMNAALDQPSTTYATLSALMGPAVPFYIVINSSMEMFIVQFALFTNWKAGPERKAYVVIAVLLYFVTRVWTYAVFAETRLAISDRTLSDADVEWFRQTLSNDYRIYLELIVLCCFILAAFIRGRSESRSSQGLANQDRRATVRS